MTDLVSIVIPVYNAEKYLEETILSCIHQTYPNIEIIAINDGSTDNSLEILKKYSDQINIISKENGGQSSALNAGIKVMTGDWIKCLNDDDVNYPNAIQELISETKKFPNDKKIIYYSDFDYIDSNSKIIGKHVYANRSHLSQFDQNVSLLHNMYGNVSSSLIHKEVFEKYGLWTEEVKYATDYELWLRLCLQYGFRMHRIPKTLLKYRLHPGQLSREMEKFSPNEAEIVRNLVLERLEAKLKQKYLIALEHFNRRQKIKKITEYLLVKLFGISITKKFGKIYLKLTGKSYYG